MTQKVAELPSIVAELRQRVVDTDTDKLRESARRNASVVRTNAQAAQERAPALYTELVARGEQVVARQHAGPNDALVARGLRGSVRRRGDRGEVAEGDVTARRPRSRRRRPPRRPPRRLTTVDQADGPTHSTQRRSVRPVRAGASLSAA